MHAVSHLSTDAMFCFACSVLGCFESGLNHVALLLCLHVALIYGCMVSLALCTLWPEINALT
jgi:hypothetical protein